MGGRHDRLLHRPQAEEEARQPAHRLRLGLLAAAAVLDAHVGDRGATARVLPGAMVRGSTWPEKRSTSTLALTPICFSPATIRWPLGSTRTTVTVMVPVKSLLFSVVPLPSKSFLWVASARARLNELALANGSAVMPAVERALAVDRAGGLLRRADLLGDQHRQRVADEARAVVLEQRPVAVALEDGAVVAHRRRHGGRLDALGVEHLHRRHALHLLEHARSAHSASSEPAQRRRRRVIRRAPQALHSWPRRCSIWSEVWIALELIS